MTLLLEGGRYDVSTALPVAAVHGHIKAMWEANCSCRTAGYPETSFEELNRAWGDASVCSGLPSPMDVPTMSQAVARESAAELLHHIRQLAGLVWPDHPAAAAATSSCSNGIDPASYADWEVLQSELLELPSTSSSEGLPAASSSGCSWGEALWCFNPTCTNLSGPSELALPTFACSGGCGVRYCSPECQARGWRDGHRLSCGRLKDRSAAAHVTLESCLGPSDGTFGSTASSSVRPANNGSASELVSDTGCTTPATAFVETAG